MKRFVLGIVLLSLSLLASGQQTGKYGLMTGDVLFQDFDSGLSEAIKKISQSDFSHVGMVLVIDGKTWVFEAVSPVRLTEIDSWIARNDRGYYEAKRLANRSEKLSPQLEAAMIKASQNYLGKPYDIQFAWSDKAMYCSELVWKMYERVLGLEVGQVELLKELDLSSQVVQETLFQLYGNRIPYEERVISPQSIYECPALIQISPTN